VSGAATESLASRSGVDPEYVEQLVELGILSPGSG
jgi:hypothetical protein